MSKGLVRILLTILMYAGIAIFCVPYFLGGVDGLRLFQVAGAVGAVVCGMTRCFWSEEECWWHVG